MSAPSGYFVAPDANGDVWIWRERGDYPVPVVAYHDFKDDPELWDYFTSDLPATHESTTRGLAERTTPSDSQRVRLAASGVPEAQAQTTVPVPSPAEALIRSANAAWDGGARSVSALVEALLPTISRMIASDSDSDSDSDFDCLRCARRVMRGGIKTDEGWFHVGCHTNDEIQRRQWLRHHATEGEQS